MAANAISQGSLRSIFDQGVESVNAPVLQCMQIKAMENKSGGEERYRIVLSDIRNFIPGMIAQQSNEIVTSGKLKKGSIVRPKQFQPAYVKEKKVLIIIDMDILDQYGECERVGEPVALEPKSSEQQDVKPQPQGISSGGFYGNSAPQQQLPTPARTLPSRTSTTQTSNSGHPHLYPIEALSPYAHKWTIKVRCTHKSEIKTWHNNSGEGKLFSVNLLDESGEIRATGFKDQCDALYDVFQEGGVYYISSPCSVKFANKKFSNLNNDYELTFESGTVVEKAPDEDASVPQVRYNFTSIGDLESVENNTTIDTIGILKDVAEVSQVTSKTTHKPFSKRELTLADSSLKSVRLTIWGATAENFDAPPDSVIAFKSLRVSDFGGRSLSLLSSGSMSIDPDIDEAHKLKGWFDAQGRHENFNTFERSMVSGGSNKAFKTVQQIKDENIGMGEQAEYFNLKATVAYIKSDSFAYAACQTQDCNKKVTEVNTGEWRCEKCEKSYDKPQYRYILTINVSDHTGQMWLSLFDDTAKVIMAISAGDLHEMRENEAPEMFTDTVHARTYMTWNFNCRAKMDTYLDQQRVRYQVSSVQPLNFSVECAKLTELINKYNIQSDSLFVS